MPYESELTFVGEECLIEADFNLSNVLFSFISDTLTLQLWKDRRDWERNPPSKGSIALQNYLGWESSFTLDKESITLALVLKEALVVLAFDSRETLMRWQVCSIVHAIMFKIKIVMWNRLKDREGDIINLPLASPTLPTKIIEIE